MKLSLTKATSAEKNHQTSVMTKTFFPTDEKLKNGLYDKFSFRRLKKERKKERKTHFPFPFFRANVIYLFSKKLSRFLRILTARKEIRHLEPPSTFVRISKQPLGSI